MERKITDDILDPIYNFQFDDENYDYSGDYIDSICLNCGKIGNVPNFIYLDLMQFLYI